MGKYASRGVIIQSGAKHYPQLISMHHVPSLIVSHYPNVLCALVYSKGFSDVSCQAIISCYFLIAIQSLVGHQKSKPTTVPFFLQDFHLFSNAT
mgnify:FL=1